MEVVAAGVHDPGDLGGVGQARLLGDGQRVHVRPEGDGPAGPAAPDEGRGARFQQGGVLDIQLRQNAADQPGGVPLLIAQLRAADYSKFDLGKVYMFILLAILPVLVVYIFLSKSIIKGVTAGSVKG